MTQQESHISRRKKSYFKLLSLLLVFLFFALIEIILRMFSYGTDMHLFVRHDSESMENYLMVNPQVGHKYFSHFEATTGTNDVFLRRKPENGVRIFLLGSSTLYGYPYDHNLMASRILHRRLQETYPQKSIEVVNTSITAINSITLKDFVGQVLEYEPDAILIYAGHNEFYGAFGPGSHETLSKSHWLVSVHLKLINLRIYQLMRSSILKLSNLPRGRAEASEEKGTLMKRIVKDENIEYQGKEYQAGLTQYSRNMNYILKRAAKEDVAVFISDLVCNVKDLPPFGDTKDADLNAKKSYQEAMSRLSAGDTLEARRLFYLAKDLDPVRFRASEDINEIIYELASQYRAHLIPTKERFSNVSAGGLIGNNLLTEHVHPNIEGQFILADAFYSALVESGMIAGDPGSPAPKSSEYYRHNWAYTPLDSLVGVYKIEHLKSYWPFTSLTTEISFRDTFQTSGLLDSLAFSILTDPGNSIESLHLQLADHYEQIGEWNLALKENEALISTNPYYASYYNRAANCLLKQNDLYAAELYLLESVRYRKNLYAYSLLGEIETIKHNYSGAVDIYNNALEIATNDRSDGEEQKALVEDIRRKLSNALTRSERPLQQGGIEYSKYIPSDIESIYNRAFSLTQSDSDSALNYYMLCLEINDCPLVNFRIGNILYQKQDKRALHYYNKAYDGFAKDPDFLVRYCVASIYNQEISKAREIFNELTSMDPAHPDIPSLKKAL